MSKVYVAPVGTPPPILGCPIGTPDDPWTLIGEGDVGGWTDGPAFLGGEAVLVAVRPDDGLGPPAFDPILRKRW